MNHVMYIILIHFTFEQFISSEILYYCENQSWGITNTFTTSWKMVGILAVNFFLYLLIHKNTINFIESVVNKCKDFVPNNK